MAKYDDIDNWKYSVEQLNEMHEILDVKEEIEKQAKEASNG